MIAFRKGYVLSCEAHLRKRSLLRLRSRVCQFSHSDEARLGHFEQCIDVEVRDGEGLVFRDLFENVLCDFQAVSLLAGKQPPPTFDDEGHP